MNHSTAQAAEVLLQFPILLSTSVIQMDMIDREVQRLENRVNDLTSKVVPDLEHRTQMLYSHIMTLAKHSEEREKLEAEYTSLAKELTLRSDEIVNTRQQLKHLELEKKQKR